MNENKPDIKKLQKDLENAIAIASFNDEKLATSIKELQTSENELIKLKENKKNGKIDERSGIEKNIKNTEKKIQKIKNEINKNQKNKNESDSKLIEITAKANVIQNHHYSPTRSEQKRKLCQIQI